MAALAKMAAPVPEKKGPPAVEVPETEEPPGMTLEQALDPDSLVTWDCPVAPQDARRTRKLRQKQGLPVPDQSVPNVQADDVISRFIPVREWTDPDGTQWVQRASTVPAPRIGATILGEKLDKKLWEVQARPTGICTKRSAIYRECFDEVLRQVTSESVERGILLLKVRQERERTIEAYKQLLESRAGYAFRIALKGDKDTYSIKARIQELQKKKQDLIQEEQDLKEHEKKVREDGEETAYADDKRRKDEMALLNKEGTLKKAQLEAITALPKR